MRNVKLWAVLAATLALGGCNLVISEKPVFFAEDARGAPPFKPGVWAAPDPGCAFDVSQPLDKWPSCANAAILSEDTLSATVDASLMAPPDQSPAATAAERKLEKLPYVLAAGDPRVMQVGLVLPVEAGQATAFFYFVAVKPTKVDDEHRIIEAETWPIQCGPPPPKPPPNATDTGTGMTTQPLPGMTIAKNQCTPNDKAAVLNAAAPSRAWADAVGTLKWVKDAPK